MNFPFAPKFQRVGTVLFVFAVALSILFVFFSQVSAMEPPVITAVTPNQVERGSDGVVLRFQIQDMPPEVPTAVTIGAEAGTDIDYDPAGVVTATFNFPSDMPLNAFTVTVTFDGPMGIFWPRSNSEGVLPVVEAGSLVCFTTYGSFTTTQFNSVDGSAVQDAVDAAVDGETVKVAGTCAGVQGNDSYTQTVYIDKNLTLQGGYRAADWTAEPDSATYPTILDANGESRVALISGTVTVTLDSLTIQNGYLPDASPSQVGDGGAGIYISSGDVTITNSIITANENENDGGGVSIFDGTLNVSSSLFSEISPTTTAAA